MYKSALVMTMLLASTYGWGQQPITFDTVLFNPVNSFLLGASVFEIPSGYQVFGLGGNGTGSVQTIRSIQFDPTGGLVGHSVINDNELTDIGSLDPVTVCSSGGYATGVTRRIPGDPIDSLFAFRFDSEGELVWSKFLAADNTMVIRQCRELSGQDLVFVGLHEYPRGGFMFRTTSEGDSIRFINFGYPAFYASGIAEDENQNLVIAGATDEPPPYNGAAYLLKCTPEGNVLWRRSRPTNSWFAQVFRTQDGEWVALGSSENELGHATALICRYSDNGDLIWAKEDIISADTQTRECSFGDGFEQPDGTIIACGTIRNTDLGLFDKGLLYHLDAAGNVLWSRFYSHYAGLPAGYPQYFNDVEPTSDGGFILTGQTHGLSPPNPVRLWLVKLDSMGCLVPGCHTVGVEEFESQLQSALQVSPNPANEYVKVTLTLPEGYRLDGAVQAIVVDAQGKEVLRQQANVAINELRGTLDVRGLSAGLYYVHLRDAEKWLAGGKVVVSAR